MLEIGSVIDGKYKILNQIGKGGMSVVYLALNERANKTWAIKEVRKDGVQDFATVKQGLIAETDTLKRLNHKYLPSIIDVIDDEDTFLIVMDYIEGKSLNKVLKESMEQTGLPIGIEDVLSWGIQLCDVLNYLHTREKPIVYRDLKPSNIMLRPNGEITLIDFGTAREFKIENIEDTTSLGTPGYAAPEQYGSQDHKGKARPESDIYCLGATLHHLITGRNPAATPFNFPPITQCRTTLLEETPREFRNELLGLEMILTKCTQQEPEQRYRSCAQLQYDLEHPEELGLPYRRKLKNKMLAFSVSVGLAVVMGVGSLTGAVLAKKTETSGYDYYVESAQTASMQDKITYYKKAIALNPEAEDKSANNGTVAPHISISDTNFITSGVKVTLKGANRGDVKIDSLANITSSATGMNVIFKDFPEGMDDIYTLTAKVTDKAGNETTSSITFSVNRDGSTYEIGSSTKALIDKKYTNKPQDLEITEINVDDLTTIEITYSLDGKVVTLKEGEDYTITKSGEDGQWKKYVYKIKASCFEKEGNYVINIYSEDAAHNSTTNKTKAKTIEFTVDKTAPTMVVSNLADRGRYKENTHEFTLNVKDNIYLAYVEVYLDGELFKRFEEDEIAQLNGELLVDIASSNQYQTIELVSCDKAGNISKEVYDPETNKQVPASYKVLVTQNSFVQFINNTPLLISVIVIFVAIIVLIIVLVKRKKDKQK